MRRRLVLLSSAVTLIVSLAFLLPLTLVVRDLAEGRAMSAGERRADEVARRIAARSLDETRDAADLILAGADETFAASVILPDGTVVGAPLLEGESRSPEVNAVWVSATVSEGRVIYTPVDQEGQTSIVRVVVPSSELSRGLTRSWVLIGAVCAAMVALGGFAADLLGRSIVRPARELAETAARLGEGEFGARVDPAGPREIHDVAVEFNKLADRFTRLLQQERNAAADISHRLRTPLTALRLNAEGLEESEGKQRLLDDLDNFERTADFLIRQSLRPVVADGAMTDLRAIVAERLAFWSPLAEEQSREFSVDIDDAEALVRLTQEDAEALVDVLLDNIFSHVPEGTPISVWLAAADGRALLAIEDGGDGFPDDSVVKRGISKSESTGLGLDIVRRTAESAGGRLTIGASSDLGGARVIVELPLAGG